MHTHIHTLSITTSLAQDHRLQDLMTQLENISWNIVGRSEMCRGERSLMCKVEISYSVTEVRRGKVPRTEE
ncbi:hypothetical protein E2C01_072856 [Portunus trituberculatus]|uniref:Uncharacterized protein n=1 Tax=Portunus trituberculatus TaxID=210409 RepID=A0A5B7HZ64_PORTR|nr:hypothetical protein [Portunus trituberculatus]